VLAAHSLDRRAVIRVDVDPLDLDRLVPGCERDPLDIGREGNSIDADQIQFFRDAITVSTFITSLLLGGRIEEVGPVRGHLPRIRRTAV
jgi:hypothetical protein